MAKDILFIGDSLMEFFDWQGRFPEHRIWNLGRAGETVEGLLSRTPAIARDHPSADFVFIMSGINNAAMEDTGFVAAYGEVLALLTKFCPGARICVNSLLPTLLPWVPDETIRRLNGSLETLAAAAGAEYLDVCTPFARRGVRDCLMDDGVHVSDTGYAIWSAAIEKVIEDG